jgi:hypothetical protein
VAAQRSLFLSVVALMLTATACGSPTASDPIPIVLQTMVLETQQQYEAWPSTPIVEANGVLTIRGIALAGCGTLDASASRSGRTVNVRVITVGDRSPCELSRWPWFPFTATIDGLDAGVWKVYVTAVGHPDRTGSTVVIQ